MISRIVDMTPVWAKRILQKNTRNRPLCRARIEQIKGDIEEGRWRLTHQGIAIGRDGTLLDGQHRLNAIVEADKTVQVMLFEKCDSKTFDVIDQGQRRNHADLYVLMGGNAEGKFRQVVAAASAMLRSSGASKCRASEIAQHALSNEETLIPIVSITCADRMSANSMVDAALAKAACEYGVKAVLPLATRYAEQTWSGVNDPLKALRDRVVLRKLKRPQERESSSELYAFAVNAISKAIEGRTVKSLKKASFDFAGSPS